MIGYLSCIKIMALAVSCGNKFKKPFPKMIYSAGINIE